MMYIPKSSQNALNVFFRKLDDWSLRFALEKGFDCFLEFFKKEGVISVDWIVGSGEDEDCTQTQEASFEEDCPENVGGQGEQGMYLNREGNQSHLTQHSNTTGVTVNRAANGRAEFDGYLSEGGTPGLEGSRTQNRETILSSNTNEAHHDRTPKSIRENNTTQISEITQENYRDLEDDLTVKQKHETPVEEDIPTANKGESNRNRSRKRQPVKNVGSFEQYLSENTGSGPSILFQPKTMDNLNKLPDIKRNRNYTLVLDLDETLVHFEESEDGNQFLIRPFAQNFLEEMSEYYELVIFTAGLQEVTFCPIKINLVRRFHFR
jgi:hypothetical protein